MEQRQRFTRVQSSTLPLEEKGTLTGLLTRQEVVEIVNLYPTQPSDEELCGIIRTNAPQPPQGIVHFLRFPVLFPLYCSILLILLRLPVESSCETTIWN